MASKRKAPGATTSPASSSSSSSSSNEEPEMVIIDTDPGVDDSMALLLALTPHDQLQAIDKRLKRLNVIGLTIVHGNANDVRKLGRNACIVLDVAGRPDIPVYLGAETPLLRPRHGGAPHVHGGNGIGDYEAKNPSTQPVEPEKCTAAEFMVSSLRKWPGKVTIVALGPLTNIAAALTLEPRLPRLAKRIVVMAGAVAQPGNVTRLAEANVWNDPESAHLVFNPVGQPWANPIIQLTLNLTKQFVIDDKYLRLVKEESRVGSFVWGITRFYMQFFHKSFQQDYMFVHDSSCILAVMAPHLFTSSRMLNIDVECAGTHTRGVTVGDLRSTSENADTSREANVQMMLTLDATEAKRVLRQCYAAYGKAAVTTDTSTGSAAATGTTSHNKVPRKK